MKEAPFVRLVIPFIAGISFAYYQSSSFIVTCAVIAICLIAITLFPFTSLSFRFKYNWIYAILINVMMMFSGCLMTQLNDHSEDVRKLADLSLSGAPVIVTIKEPLLEKPKSFKALTHVSRFSTDVLVYFRKDSTQIKPQYGNSIAFIKPLQSIENLPVFGAFDYKKYCGLKNIHYQVFLKPEEFVLLKGRKRNRLDVFLFEIRQWVLGTIKKYIQGEKESGLAEALLIGYKEDVDNELMKSYSNTGVIHVIAISGLHLGLIYMLLKQACLIISSVQSIWRSRNGAIAKIDQTVNPRALLKSMIIISGLWIFGLLAGGSPSVMRSAVMFTFIVAGELFSKSTSIYNNLAASAFFLLCYNPYWLWDLGFQLSYSALLSIVIFQKPIYQLFVFKNRIMDNIWKLNAVTISAQILTTPLCIFYFNQFPNLFLITNFIAVPCSGIILMGEIGLCAVSCFPAVAAITGKALYYLIYLMNSSVEYLAALRFSTTTNLHISFPQLVTCYAIVVFTSFWLIRKDRFFLFPALAAVFIFIALGQMIPVTE